MGRVLKPSKFWFGDVVYHKLTGEPGMILNVVYESAEFYFYTVHYTTGIDKSKEDELLTEEEFKLDQDDEG